MTTSKKISLIAIDSGLGGIEYLKILMSKLNPQTKKNDLSVNSSASLYINYIADKDYCPYYKLSDQNLFNRVNFIKSFLAKKIIKNHPSHYILIACNTLSCFCNEHHLNFNPDIEQLKVLPMLDQLPKKYNFKHYLFIATQNTINSSIVKDQISKLKAQGTKIECLHHHSLVRLIEESCLMDHHVKTSLINEQTILFERNLPQFIKKLKQTLNNNPAIDSIVLGCTHYSYIKNSLDTYLKKNNFNVKIIDNSDLNTDALIDNLITHSDWLKTCNKINSVINFYGNYHKSMPLVKTHLHSIFSKITNLADLK